MCGRLDHNFGHPLAPAFFVEPGVGCRARYGCCTDSTSGHVHAHVVCTDCVCVCVCVRGVRACACCVVGAGVPGGWRLWLLGCMCCGHLGCACWCVDKCGSAGSSVAVHSGCVHSRLCTHTTHARLCRPAGCGVAELEALAARLADSITPPLHHTLYEQIEITVEELYISCLSIHISRALLIKSFPKQGQELEVVSNEYAKVSTAGGGPARPPGCSR